MEAGSSKQSTEANQDISPQTDQTEKGPQSGESRIPPSDQHQSSPSPLLTQLPTEILHNIVGLLRNRDIKQLRLSCRFFARVAALRLNRVFLSANPLNIQVFRAIADHEAYRQGIVELIYDDAHLPRSAFEVNAARISHYHRHPWAHHSGGGITDDEEWFEIECSRNATADDAVQELQSACLSSRERAKYEQAAAEMPFEECWTYYQDLVRQQDEIIASNADMEALLYGLERFPSLTTITVTPAAHGYLYEPLYETPMIRSFPYGFNHYVPRGWPTREKADVRDGESLMDEPGPWVGEDESLLEKIRSSWRGCLLVLRALAQARNNNVSELLIDSYQLETGLSCRMFDEPCDAYKDLVAVLERPGMRRFHISLLVDEQWWHNWSSFRSGLLKKALEKCVDMEDFALTTDLFSCDQDWHDYPPLEVIIPIHCWPRLQHLKLWNLLVNRANLIDFLSQLPQTLRSLELSLLRFFPNPDEDYFHLLSDMRSTLGWRERLIQPRIKIAVRHPNIETVDTTIVTWLDKEVNEYLYGLGGNPFEGLSRKRVPGDIGIIRDSLYPDFETTPAEIKAENEIRLKIGMERIKALQDKQKLEDGRASES